jgi:hypothetical protein
MQKDCTRGPKNIYGKLYRRFMLIYSYLHFAAFISDEDRNQGSLLKAS